MSYNTDEEISKTLLERERLKNKLKFWMSATLWIVGLSFLWHQQGVNIDAVACFVLALLLIWTPKEKIEEERP